jgi:hypothetical protein
MSPGLSPLRRRRTRRPCGTRARHHTARAARREGRDQLPADGGAVFRIGSAVGAQVAGTIIAANVLAAGLPETAGSRSRSIGGIGPVIAALSVLLIPGRSRAAVGEPAASTA